MNNDESEAESNQSVIRRKSSVSHHLSADDLHVETCLGRGTCSSVWRSRQRQSSSCQQQRRQMGEVVERELSRMTMTNIT
jgi:hypothetical protein